MSATCAIDLVPLPKGSVFVNGVVMLSVKPYMLKAIHQWILDNDWTPYLLVNTQVKSVQVPSEHIRDNRIVLNIAPQSIRGFQMDNDAVSFEARFSGRAQVVWVPIAAVEALYAKENGEGMSFEVDLHAEPVRPDSSSASRAEDKEPAAKVSHLKVIK